MRSPRPSPRPPLAAIALPALFALLGAARPVAADGTPLSQQLDQKAPAIVCVKIVAKVHGSFMGQTREREQKLEMRGVTIDPSGLVMLDDGSAQVRAILRTMSRQAPGATLDVVPTSIKVLFGNEAKEYEAVLVARDTILGLAFVQIVDLEGRTPSAVDLTTGGEPRLGQACFTVGRLPRGFDCAPQLGRFYLSMRVSQPRPMWGVTGDAQGTGLPAFDLAGKPVGVLAFQEGAEGSDQDGNGPDAGVFLLPLSAVQKSVAAAKKRIPEALEKAKAAKEAPKDPEPPPAMDGEK